MSALAQLHRDPIAAGAHVLALPPWLPPAPSRTGVTGTYWHQPRSGNVRSDGRITLHLWCGQMRYLRSLSVLTSLPPPELRCGTCVGRRAGYDRADGTIFQPRDHWALPAWCPSTTPDDRDYDLCVACGRKTNAARGWSAYGLARHRPDPLLGLRHRPCPWHGWRDLREREGNLACTAWPCGYVSVPA